MDKFAERVALDARLTARVLTSVIEDLTACGLIAQAHLLAQLRDHYRGIHAELSETTPVPKGRITLRGFPSAQVDPPDDDA
ncbi:MAG: hypothetical protein AAFP15_18570 [Bacteroidota bacterium]